MAAKPFFVMRVTQIGERSVVATRYGRWFGNQQSAARVAENIRGQVYKRGDDGVSRLVQDCTGKPLNNDQLDGWQIGRSDA